MNYRVYFPTILFNTTYSCHYIVLLLSLFIPETHENS
jgi:hypothetical protein